MLAGLLGLVVLLVRLFPETPLGKSLHLHFVELPMRLARRIERRHLILLAILICSGQTLALMGSVELGLAYAADLSLYYDAAITASLAAVAAYVKNVRTTLTRTLSRWFAPILRAKARPRRKRAVAEPRKASANDDDPVRFVARAA